MRYRPLSVLAVMLLIAFAGCGGGQDEPTTEDQTAATSEETTTATEETSAEEDASEAEAETEAGAEGAGTTVAVGSSDLGDILVDGEGRTLYLLLEDDQGVSVCYEDCVENWPPLPGPAEAGEGVDGSLLGTVERQDGSTQATYNDWPLYHFAADQAPGDVLGQGIYDVWYVVGPDGQAIQRRVGEAT